MQEILDNINNALKVKEHQLDNKFLEVILSKTVTTKVVFAKITTKVVIKINTNVKEILKIIVVTTIKICK